MLVVHRYMQANTTIPASHILAFPDQAAPQAEPDKGSGLLLGFHVRKE